jgi:hypothetical protein
MKKAVWSGIIAAATFCVLSGPAYAQVTDSAALSVTVNVNARAKLTLSAASITFADADPDVTPTLAAPALDVGVKARTSGGSSVTLTVVASDDLKTAGGDTIPISGLTWTATGASFVAGTSDKTTAQSVGTWTGSGNRTGTQSYSLPNSWSYAIGSYAATLNYTLTAP